MTTYRVREPDDWGMRWERPPVAQAMPVPVKYVHHSAGNPMHTLTADEAFRRMNELAISEGLSAIDYTVMVHEHPATDTVTIGVARAQWLPAATRDQNSVSKAVCALGYFHPGHTLSAQPSARMLEGLAQACALLMQRQWVTGNSETRGHRDNPVHPNATACPGEFLYPHIGAIHRRALELVTPVPPLPTPGTITVQAGEGWWAVARRAGVPVDALILANPMPLHPGMVLKVPAKT